MNKYIGSFSVEELSEQLSVLGEPSYRAVQIYEWLHNKNAISYDEMTNLPKSLRKKLQETWPLQAESILEVQTSNDKTKKYLIELTDGNTIESVGIPSYKDAKISHLTACISSQVGCALACDFCATGKLGFSRNLTPDEIIQQVVLINKDFGERIDNLVLMGQGEPFLNYDNTIEAIRRINSDKGLGIGARHITISTSGIVDRIYDFSELKNQFRLAISLHSADQNVRNMLMPNLSNQPLSKLRQAIGFYNNVKNRRVTIEYMLLENINDDDTQLSKLISFCSSLNVHINLLPFNSIEKSPYRQSSLKTFEKWVDQLSKHFPTSCRLSRGKDINGACGQLSLTKNRNI